MKYSKEAVMERINAYLERVKTNEEASYQRQLSLHAEQLVEQRKVRISITEHLIDGLQGLESIGTDDPYAFQELYKAMARVGTPVDGSHRNQNYYVMEKLRLAQEVLVPPVKSTRESDELASIIKVFETGAPPEVSVNDLRGFGLMNLIKYGRP